MYVDYLLKYICYLVVFCVLALPVALIISQTFTNAVPDVLQKCSTKWSARYIHPAGERWMRMEPVVRWPGE